MPRMLPMMLMRTIAPPSMIWEWSLSSPSILVTGQTLSPWATSPFHRMANIPVWLDFKSSTGVRRPKGDALSFAARRSWASANVSSSRFVPLLATGEPSTFILTGIIVWLAPSPGELISGRRNTMPVLVWSGLTPRRKALITWQIPECEAYLGSRYMSTWHCVDKY